MTGRRRTAVNASRQSQLPRSPLHGKTRRRSPLSSHQMGDRPRHMLQRSVARCMPVCDGAMALGSQ